MREGRRETGDGEALSAFSRLNETQRGILSTFAVTADVTTLL